MEISPWLFISNTFCWLFFQNIVFMGVVQHFSVLLAVKLQQRLRQAILMVVESDFAYISTL